MDELRNDILDYAGIDDTTSETLEQSQYTKADENRERERAAQALMQERYKVSSNNDSITKEMQDMKNLVMKIAKEKEDLKNEISQLKGHVTTVSEENNQRALKEIMDIIEKEKSGIKADEVLSQYYNEQDIIQNLQKNSAIGKVLTPKEQLAILNFENVAKENAELKQKLENRGLMLHRPIGKISSSSVIPNDDDVDVRSLSYEDYKALQKKRQMKAMESMLG
ncbi:MAG: hypothetical protein HGB12_00195 [Bacteroidetes bacterium]|nr:hypothetical protein [Bacteroidota bacterium]